MMKASQIEYEGFKRIKVTAMSQAKAYKGQKVGEFGRKMTKTWKRRKNKLVIATS